MKKLLKYLKPYTKETVLGPLGKLCEATLELIVPLVVAAIIDKGIALADVGYIWSMTGVLVLLGALGLGFSVFAQYFSAKAAVGFVRSVRVATYSHIQTLSYNDVDRIGTSTIVTRMTTDSDRVQQGLNLALRLLLRSPFVVFGALIMAFVIDPGCGAVFAAVIPILAIIVFGIMLITTPMYKRVQSGVDKILGRVRANLGGARVIRAFAMEDSEVSKFNSENDSLTKAQKKAGRISALLNPLTFVVINLGIILLIYTGALKVDLGELTQGEVIALYNYMSQILIELIKLANLIISITKALASASRISSIFDIESSQTFGERTEGEGADFILELDRAALKYHASPEYAVENISFGARRGEIIGIIGGTGSGKSSLISLIPRLYDASLGQVRLDGADIKEYTKEAICSQVRIVPQKAVLFSGTVRDNLLFGGDGTDEELIRALKIAKAYDFVMAAGGLDARVEAGGRNLSGGQRQRLTIARALVGQPKILILDDSFSALDYKTDAELRAALRESVSDTTLIIASQRTASIMHADKIIVMEDGEAVGIGTHASLMESCEIYREIYESQFKKEAAI